MSSGIMHCIKRINIPIDRLDRQVPATLLRILPNQVNEELFDYRVLATARDLLLTVIA